MADQTPETKPETSDVKGSADIEKIVEKAAQSAADRVRTEYSQKLKEAQTENEELRKEKMSAKERADFEAQQLKDNLEKKERELNHRELQLLATKALEKEGLDSEFIDYVIGTDKDATLGKIAQLKKSFDGAVAKAMERTLKEHGRDPNKGRDSSGTTSDIAGMTPEQIKKKGFSDPEWFDKHKQEILEALASGSLKK
jgi:hypothetical protein